MKFAISFFLLLHVETFLGKLADYLSEKHPSDLGTVCVIFPSRRAGVFLNDNFKSGKDTSILLPETLSFEEFLKEVSRKIFPDAFTLAFELYPAYKEIFPEENFSNYYSWASVILNDFEEAIQSLEDPSHLFRNLHQLKKLDATIESWHQENSYATDFQEKYLSLWESLPYLFQSLLKNLGAKGMATPAMAMRELMKEPAKLIASLRWKKIYFAGFNALSKVQEEFMKVMFDSGLAEFFWDVDVYYLENERQEAGKFLRAWKKSWKLDDFRWTENFLLTEEKNIEAIGVAGISAQATAAGNLLASIPAPEGAPFGAESLDRRTALILPDESLLLPVLHSLPPSVTDINVTMGFPLKSTALYSLVIAILDMQENAARHLLAKGEFAYYHKDLLGVIGHPYILGIAFEEVRELRKFILEQNLGYINLDELQEFRKKKLFHLLFEPFTEPATLAGIFLEIFREIRDSFLEESEDSGIIPSMELEYLFHFHTLTMKLKERISEFKPGMDLKTLRQVFREMIAQAGIPFSGEPLKGLQVMGVLETRNLDFENVIILSSNEEIFPSNSNPATFIPFSLRKAFGLPTYEERDAVYAYHFYRLIQRAKNIYFIYNTETGKSGGKERSRFIEQLAWELANANPKIKFIESILSHPIQKETVPIISRKKNPEIMEMLNSLAREKGFSPSGLNTYLQCSLKFFFNYVLKIGEKKEVEESPDSGTFGSVFHAVMENLYGPYAGKQINEDDFSEIEKRLPEVVILEFRNEAKTKNTSFGKNKILIGVIESLARSVIEIDKQGGPLEILELETEVSIEIPPAAGVTPVKLNGRLDRIDRAAGKLRIIDYKTGEVSNYKMKDPSLAGLNPEHKEAFQLACYALIYHEKYKPGKAVQSAIICMRQLHEGVQPVEFGSAGITELSASDLEPFKTRLKEIIREILNPDIPFIQTEEIKRCEYCDYKVICTRQ